MTLALFMRRTIVVAGVVAALLVGAVSIRAAGEWTAASAPLAVPPASLTSIDAALQAEQDRSANLEAQLKSLESASSDLAAALQAAQEKITSDAATAATLRQNLASAQAKLKSLQTALSKASRAASVQTTTQPAPATTTSPTVEPHDD
jgi:peptidoglycan hydrolase CwlO-like protein